MSPVNELHQGLRQSFEGNYLQAKAVNNSPGSFLAMLGIDQKEVNKVMYSTDKVLNELLQSTGTMNKRPKQLRPALKKSRRLKNPSTYTGE